MPGGRPHRPRWRRRSRCSTPSRKGHETTPPARFTEASLIKELERPGHRPAVHVRADDRYDRPPRLRVPAEQGARAQLHRRLPSPSSCATTSATSSRRISPPRWRTTSMRSRAASARSHVVPEGVLLRRSRSIEGLCGAADAWRREGRLPGARSGHRTPTAGDPVRVSCRPLRSIRAGRRGRSGPHRVSARGCGAGGPRGRARNGAGAAPRPKGRAPSVPTRPRARQVLRDERALRRATCSSAKRPRERRPRSLKRSFAAEQHDRGRRSRSTKR